MTLLDKIIQSLSGGFFSIGGMIKVSAAGIVTERDKFFTQQGVSKVYQINEMRPVYTHDLISTIIREVTKLDNTLSVKCYYDVTNTYVSVNTPAYTSKMNRTIRDYVELKAEFEKLPKELQESGIYHDNGVNRWSFTIKDLLKKKHRYDSYVDVSNHLRQENGVYFLVSLFVTVVFRDLDSFNSLNTQVEAVLKREVARVTSIDKNIASLLSNMSPSTLNTEGVKSPTILVSEENLTHLLPFRAEGVLSTTGIPIGTNISNLTPLFLPIFSSPEGASTLIAAKAGKGKSTLGYVYTLQLVGAMNTVVYIDLKGTEVSSCLGQAMDSIRTVDFSSKSSSFVNTMHVSKFIPGYTVEDAIKVTAEMLAIFVNVNEITEGNSTDVTLILSHAIRSYYNSVGVKDGVPETYYLSEQMTYLKIIHYIGEQSQAEKTDRLQGLYEIIPTRLAEAFLQFGLNTNDNAIDLDELFGYSVIVFAFNKNTDVQMTLIDQVRVYMVLMVTKRLAHFNKSNDLFTCLMAEEGQRYLRIPALCQGISDLASGSRSDNLNVTMIMNDLNILRQESLSSFRSNIANFIIGSCDEEAVKILREVFLKEKLADDVRSIIKNPKKYERVFAVHFEIGSTEINSLIRCDIPEEVAKMFATRTVLLE